MFFIVLVIPEICFDLRFDRKLSWKQPSIIAKIVFFIYLICTTLAMNPLSSLHCKAHPFHLGASYQYVFQAHAAVTGGDPSGGWEIKIPNTLSVLFLGWSYVFIVIGWYLAPSSSQVTSKPLLVLSFI